MAKTTFEVGDAVMMKGSDDVTLTVIEVDGAQERVTVAWFADGPEFRITSLPFAALKFLEN
jgi:hypothetical protein